MTTHHNTSRNTSPLQSTGGAGGTSLRNRLLLLVMPALLAPLAISGLLATRQAHKTAEQDLEEQIHNQSQLAGEVASILLEDYQNTTAAFAGNPLVIESAREATQNAEADGLNRLSIEQLESRFSESKLLDPNGTLNNYLIGTAENLGLAEIFYTDANGYNIAFSNETSDFVQRDEDWWQLGRENQQWIGSLDFDDSANTFSIDMVRSITDPNSGEFLGVIKAVIPAQAFDVVASYLKHVNFTNAQALQLIDGGVNEVIKTITAEGDTDSREVIGGETIQQISAALVTANETQVDLSELATSFADQFSVKELNLESNIDEAGETSVTAEFVSGNRFYSVATVPNTPWVAIASMDNGELQAAGNEQARVFFVEGLVLALIAFAILLLVARQLSQPLNKLTDVAKQVAEGNLDINASVQGTSETRTLAQTFNALIARVKDSLQKQEEATDEQRRIREALEEDIFSLMDDMSGAVDGDLTVRANLASEDMSTVADLFNAIIESLRDTATQVKQSSQQVSQALNRNEQSIQQMSQHAIDEAQNIRSTLGSVEEMTQSVNDVAQNAGVAATIADDAYTTVKDSSNAMSETVDSILSLRSTVGETAKKMKRLGESSQKISQVVSLIEEIALKTNLLAINASVEASRAGEQGQGFTVVAEQVGALAEQSAAATKDIAKIVASIQSETQEVSEAMEMGTSQVVDSTKLVEATKSNLDTVLEKSQEINQLMQSISSATEAQSTTAQTVSGIMQKFTQDAEERSQEAHKMAQATKATAEIAQSLRASVEQFKVDEDGNQPASDTELQLDDRSASDLTTGELTSGILTVDPLVTDKSDVNPSVV